MTGLLEALSLLTRIRVRTRPDGRPVDGCRWYGVVGALIGLVVALVLLGAGHLLPLGIAALLAVTAEVALTGALHLDGLADCADGSAGRDPQRRLAIMRDHAVGVYGTAAVVLALALRASCLLALAAWSLQQPASLSRLGVVGLVVAAWALSRSAMLVPALVLPYARHEGTGRAVVEGLTTRRAVTGVAGGVGLALLGGLLGGAAGVLSVLLAVLAVTGVVGLAVRWARSRLGGATGDLLGAVAELAGLAGLLAPLVVLTALA